MYRNSTTNLARRLLLGAAATALTAGIAFAQDTTAPTPAAGAAPATGAAPAANPTETAVGNLLQGLVDQGVLKRNKAQALMNKFHSDLGKAAPAPAPTPAPAQTAAATAAAPAEAGTVAVPYIPEIVKDEITNRVKDGVIKQAKDEHWATPNTFPEWVSRIKVSGDIRVRDEGRFFNKNNFDQFVDVNAIDTGSPYNTGSNNTTLPAMLNSTKDRNYMRVRARLGIEANIDDDWTAVIRLATGSDNAPISTNQNLGSYFGKKSVWIDQAYIKYEPIVGDALLLGRIPNPFVSTEMVWSENVNPEGVAATFGYGFPSTGLNLHAVAGAFPLDSVSDSAPSTATSDDKAGMGFNKWLFAGQLGAVYNLKPLKLSLDAAYYHFDNVQGRLSSSCSNEASYCDTDSSRPAFMQKGNTLFALRDLYYKVTTDLTWPQYYGLASKFQVLDFVAKADYAATDSFHISLTGDYAHNLGFNWARANALPIVNNNETCSVTVASGKTCSSAGGTSIFKSGNKAWLVRLTAGNPKIEKLGDWNTNLSYEFIEPDAVLDAFNDSDFHLGGTNAKGWIVGGNLGLAHNVWLSAKWMSSDAVWGPAFAEDTLQVDLNVRF